MSLIKLFCDVDDFLKTITTWPVQRLVGHNNKPGPKPKLSASEIMTILIYFHMSRYRDFKTYYTQYVQRHLRSEFPYLVSYNRFVELMPLTLLPLCLYLSTQMGEVSGISSIPHLYPFVTTVVLSATRCLPVWPPEGKPQWAGFMASNSTWWSMTRENY